MGATSRRLRTVLKDAGFADPAIDAVWPEWWGEEAENSPSATAELRYTVARRLGLAPQSLFDESPRFLWRDATRYKNLDASGTEWRAISAFGSVVAGALVAASDGPRVAYVPQADELRAAVLDDGGIVNLLQLLAHSWAMGIPVAYLGVTPLRAKRMHAMTAGARDRCAILLGRRTRFAAQLAFTLAHELGHVALGHLSDSSVVVEVKDPLTAGTDDPEEIAADRYALELLTGQAEPDISLDSSDFSGRQLAVSVMEAAHDQQIDPGILALCVGYQTGRWPQTFVALKLIPPGEQDLPLRVNQLAARQLDWARLREGTSEYLERILRVE